MDKNSPDEWEMQVLRREAAALLGIANEGKSTEGRL
jgi:hypothetical protein